MDLRDFFVASVAITIGAMMIYTALLNEGWCFQMKIARVIEESRGRGKARSFIGTVGAAMLLLGLYILLAPWIASQWLQSSEIRFHESFNSQRVIANAE